MSLQHLQLFGAGARTDGQSERVVELMDDQVQVHRLLPVYLGVADGQLFGIFAEHLDVGLWKDRGRDVTMCLNCASVGPWTGRGQDSSV